MDGLPDTVTLAGVTYDIVRESGEVLELSDPANLDQVFVLRRYECDGGDSGLRVLCTVDADSCKARGVLYEGQQYVQAIVIANIIEDVTGKLLCVER